MGLFGALTSAVSGLQSQAFAMQNISGNIANAQTIAYKGINTNFEDLITGGGVAAQQAAGGVIASAIATNTDQGSIQAATSATDMAINGDGYFSVAQPTGFNGSVPTFSNSSLYTRRGDFEMDANGYLVNGAGFYLEGILIDPTTGTPTGNVASPLRFQSNFLAASATTTITYGVNLPTVPHDTAYNASVPNSELLNPADFSTNPTLNNIAATNAVVTGTSALGMIDSSGGAITFKVNAQTVTLATNGGTGGIGHYSPSDLATAINTQVGATANVNATLNGAGDLVITSTGAPGAGDSVTVNTFSSGDATQLGFASASATANGKAADPSVGTVAGSDTQTFINESITGGSLTIYDSSGTPVDLQMRWAKVANTATSGADKWELYYQVDPNATGANVAWQNSGTEFTFNALGELSPALGQFTLNNVTINGSSLGNLSVQTPANAITQFSSTSGQATVNNMQQNGFAAGQLQTIAVGNGGIITGTFSNGQNVALAQIPLVHFNSPNNLNALTGGAYQATNTSGTALNGATGLIVGQSLEQSNTDIATEFTKLIVTQQAYSANTKVITTANQMSQDLLNVIR